MINIDHEEVHIMLLLLFLISTKGVFVSQTLNITAFVKTNLISQIDSRFSLLQYKITHRIAAHTKYNIQYYARYYHYPA